MTTEDTHVIPEYNEDVEETVPVKAEKKKPKEPKKTAPPETDKKEKKPVANASDAALSKTLAVKTKSTKREEGETTKKPVADSLPLVSSLHAMRMSANKPSARAGTSGNAHVVTRELIACYSETAIKQAIMLVPADCHTLKAKHLEQALRMQNI